MIVVGQSLYRVEDGGWCPTWCSTLCWYYTTRKWDPAVSGSQDYCQQCLPAGRIAAGLGSAQLLEIPIAIGRAECPALALLDSGASHYFLS